MSAIKIIRHFLLEAPRVKNIVKFGVYPIELPEKAQPPCILLNLAGGSDSQTLGGAGRYYETRVSVECNALTADEAIDLGEAALTTLESITKQKVGILFQDIDIYFADTDYTDVSDARSLKRRILHFRVRWRHTPAAPVAPWTVFDPSLSNSGFTISNGGLTVSNTTGGSNAKSAIASLSVSAGLWACDFALSGTGVCLGGAIDSDRDNNVALGMAGTFGINVDGAIYAGGFQTIGTLGSEVLSSDTVRLLINMTTRKFWARKNNTGNWNNSSTANPLTGAGGYAIPADMTGALRLAASPANAGAIVTLNPTPANMLTGYGGWLL